MNNESITSDTQLTLSAIEHLIRLYYSPRLFDMHRNSTDLLRENDLIVPSTQFDSGWRVTERGAAYCEALRRVPLPVQVTEWRIPA